MKMMTLLLLAITSNLNNASANNFTPANCWLTANLVKSDRFILIHPDLNVLDSILEEKREHIGEDTDQEDNQESSRANGFSEITPDIDMQTSYVLNIEQKYDYRDESLENKFNGDGFLRIGSKARVKVWYELTLTTYTFGISSGLEMDTPDEIHHITRSITIDSRVNREDQAVLDLRDTQNLRKPISETKTEEVSGHLKEVVGAFLNKYSCRNGALYRGLHLN